ncbi:hypothetical protein [Maricaulis sp. CAU 1757]
MSKLTPNQRAKLEALWRSLPAHMRATLIAAATAGDSEDPATAQLCGILQELEESTQEPAGDLAKPYILGPLRPLVADPSKTPPSRFRFSPDDVSKLWGWMVRHIAKDIVETAKKCRKPEHDPVWYEFRRSIAERLDEAVTKADRVPKDMTALLKRFGGEGRAMLSDVITLLRCSENIDWAMNQLPKEINDLDEDMKYLIKNMHEEMIERQPEASVWILLLTMGRLENPWEIFRAVELIGERSDDLVVQKTELAAIGDAVLADTGYFAAKLKQPPQTLEEARIAADLFDRFVAYSVGMTQEFGIRKDGRWGRALYGLRAEASTNVEKVLAKVPLALDAGLPEPRRGRSGRIIPAQLPNDAAIDKAEGLLLFLNRARRHATAAAIASTQKRIAEQAEKRLETAGEMLVDLVANSEGQNRTAAKDGLEITARLLEAAGRDDVAGLLRRRGNAAAAA